MHEARPLRILLVSYRFPWPLTKGDTLTVFKMAEYFGSRHNVDLVCHEPEDPVDIERVRPLVRGLHTVRFSRLRGLMRLGAATFSTVPFQVAWCASGALRDRTQRLLETDAYDVAIAYYVRPAPCIENADGPRKVVAMQLALSVQEARAAEHARSPIMRFMHRLESRRLEAYERSMFQKFDRCLLISEHDKRNIRNPVDSKIYYNPHGVDTETFAPIPVDRRDSRSIVFSGNMGFLPNEDAACFFAEEIFPKIREAIPDATFKIVGKDPMRRVRALSRHPGVDVIGSVPDISEYIGRAAVAVDPLRIGAGLQNKVLEGLSMGIPMVITSVANEGIGARDGVHCYVRDDPASFAEAVIELLQDESMRQAFADESQGWIRQKWTWEYHFERLEEMLHELASVDSTVTAL